CALCLAPLMLYSCVSFSAEGESLADAQAKKLDHLCRKLRLQPGEAFLDIGCGWGALILWAAQNYGVTATGITLSKHQFDHVTREIAARGLEGRVRVMLQDYQDLPDDVVYDKIASIGMFEHVGPRRYDQYFGKIYRVLKPGGFVMNHGITLNVLGAQSLGSGIADFVEEYVSPGGALAHVAPVIGGLARAGLELVDAEALREHYAKTLWCWLDGREGNAGGAGAGGGGGSFPCLAHIPRGLGACLRGRVAVDLAAARGQAAARRQTAASDDPGLHLRPGTQVGPRRGRARV